MPPLCPKLTTVKTLSSGFEARRRDQSLAASTWIVAGSLHFASESTVALRKASRLGDIVVKRLAFVLDLVEPIFSDVANRDETRKATVIHDRQMSLVLQRYRLHGGGDSIIFGHDSRVCRHVMSDGVEQGARPVIGDRHHDVALGTRAFPLC